MRHLALAAFCALAAQPALSLSCLRPDPASDFLAADASDDIWVIVEGRVSFDPARLPKRDLTDNTARDVDIPAKFNGKSLSKGGFDRDFVTPITLRLTCAGPWCGGAANGKVIAFLKREADRYVMIADPCGSRVYPDPSKAVRETLTQCIRGKACVPAKPRR